MNEKNFVTAGPAADRAVASQCQSEVAGLGQIEVTNCPTCGAFPTQCIAPGPTYRFAGDYIAEQRETFRAQRDELAAALRALMAWSDHPALTGLPDGAPVPASAPSFDETVKLCRAALAKAGAAP